MKTAKKKRSKKQHSRMLFNVPAIANSISGAYLDDLDKLDERVAHVVCDPIATKYFLATAKTAIMKKFIIDERSKGQEMPERDVRAYKKFFSTNHYVAYHNALLSFPPVDVHPSKLTHQQRVLLRARNFIHYVLGNLDLGEWFENCKNSSGTTLGLQYSHTNLEDKLKAPLTVTLDCEPLLQTYLRFDTHLRDHLLDTVPSDKPCGLIDVVEGSRLATVPKDESISRIINVEPTGNMFLQLGLMGVIYDRLRSFGVDVTKLQSKHKFEAYISSITGRKATIDFSSASDTVSIALVRWLFPPQWWRVIQLVRSPFAFLGKVKVDLQMTGTMGNGTTFPLETLVFLALAVAVQSHEKDYSTLVDLDKLESVSVYGDDCIIPTQYAESFCAISYEYGFMVNEAKSFIDPDMRFRESCGGDYYHGRNIRPFHLRAPQNAKPAAIEAWMYTVFNQCFKKYRAYFGADNYVYYSSLWTEWFRVMRDAQFKIKVVPPNFPEDSGIQYDCDLPRLSRLYASECQYSSIYIDKHGSVSKFNYLTFRYEQQPDLVVDAVHYWAHLREKCASNPDKELVLRKARLLSDRVVSIHGDTRPDATIRQYVDKRKGGYVVSKGSYHYNYFINNLSTSIC